MVEEPLEDAYFRWLCAKVKSNRDLNYWNLLTILHRSEFSWIVDGDQNRAADGIALREEFFRETGYDADGLFAAYPCSLLEMFIAFSRRAEFQTGNASEWFWEFIRNLGLEDFRRVRDSDLHIINEILYRLVWRSYLPNGEGSMFPLNRPRQDQRELEIWEQFCEYLEDSGRMYNIM